MPHAHLLSKTSLIALLMAAGSGQTIAQVEEIVVTAQRRSESLQDVPIVVNAFSAESLAAAGIQRTDDLTD